MAINIGSYGKTSSYEEYADKMMDNLVYFLDEDDRRKIKENNLEPMGYMSTVDSRCTIRICPEPINFLKQITKEESTQNRQQVFKTLWNSFEKIEVKKPINNRWINTTSNGINIRLGNVNGDTGMQDPAILGDDCVHGVVVGRTGAGKSVLINNIILNLITEYAPWELDLYLVDMKKVELSRYMANDDDGKYMTPHVSACAATSEVRYVVSMIQYLSDCMKARQTLFAALGIQKIKDFREKYQIVLPRIILLVDEFQQMFLEASTRERRILDECITAITKLGRATGVHLLFASQEMSGALGAKELANFKLRIALPCDSAISEQILGNSAAAKIEAKGITLVNKKGGSKEEDNIEYRTPFINDKEEDDGSPSEFSRYLSNIHDLSKDCPFKKVQKFYQEDVQEKMYQIGRIKSSKSIKEQIAMFVNNNVALIDAFILGTGVLYNNKKNDFESFFLEKGKKRNIGILCDKDNDIGNTLKTLVENFRYSDCEYDHSIIFESEILRAVYPNIVDDLTLNNTSNIAKEINYADFIKNIRSGFDRILFSLDYNMHVKTVVINFLISVIGLYSESELEEIKKLKKLNKNDISNKDFPKKSKEILKEISIESPDNIMEDIKKEIRRILSKEGDIMKALKVEDQGIESKKEQLKESKDKINLIRVLGRILSDIEKNVKAIEILQKSIKNKKYEGKIRVNWIIGTDNIDKRQDKELQKILENGTNYGELYILAGANPETLEDSFKCCNYMFINSLDEKLYMKYKMNYTKKSDDNKTMDFKIINYNQERSYKQLSFDCQVKDAPKLDFENL